MTRTTTSRFGFPADRNYRVAVSGRRYRVGSSGKQTLDLLGEIYAAGVAGDERSWLLRLRPQIRQILRLKALVVLSAVAEHSDDPMLRLLAIWLRGHCGGTLGTSSLARFATLPDERTRREVARAFQRMGAWSELRAMLDGDASDRIRRMATPHTSQPFRQRLASLTNHGESLAVPPSTRSLVIAPDLEIGGGRPPRSPWIFRLILERIRRLVAAER
jgi:hypothetical protein